MEIATRDTPRTGRKQMRSCDDCYRRKVRCDFVDQQPCHACRRSKTTCKFTRHWNPPRRKQKRQTKSHKIQPQPDEVDSEPTNVQSTPSSDASFAGSSRGEHGSLDTVVSNGLQAQAKVIGNDAIMSQELFRSGLSQFLSIGISSGASWEVFDQYERVRIAYVGTEISNLTHLVHLGNVAAASGLHHPYPHIKPPLAWRPDEDSRDPARSPGFVQDLCSFPAKEVRDDLVDSFFKHIHPYLPIIDEYAFRIQYNDPQNPPPLLLLQSILLAGSHTSQHPRVAKTRSTVKAVLYRRAKALFDMRHENDRLNLVQAALLFTWHIENADTVSSNSWYWIGAACRIAFGIGMHRDLSKYSVGRFPEQDRRLYRRVWWSLFQLEAISALEHGRPSMIRLEDFDQLPLEMDDLRDMNGVVNSNINFEYCCRKIELCYIALEVSRLSSPGALPHVNTAAVQAVNSRLVAWARAITLSSRKYESLSLHILYQTIVLQWHRTSINARVVGGSQCVDICVGAAKSIIVNFESLSAQNLLCKCHFSELASLTAAGIQTYHEVKSTIARRQALQAINGLNDLDRVLGVAKSMTDYWPNAEAVFKLFKSLSDKLSASCVFDDTISNSDQTFDETDANLVNINWHEILAYQPLEHPVNEGWLNDLPYIGGLR